MSLSLKDDVLKAVIRKPNIPKTGCKTPKLRKPTLPPNPNPNYIPPVSIKTTCTYKTPCGWCTKWDKKCDMKIGCDTDIDYDKYFHELECAVNQIDYVDRRERVYVKITTQFYNYLKKRWDLDLLHEVLNRLSCCLGVITMIDDTISHKCYEIVYLTDITTNLTDITSNKICQFEEDHQWECCGASTAGTDYRCKICGAHKMMPVKDQSGMVVTYL